MTNQIKDFKLLACFATAQTKFMAAGRYVLVHRDERHEQPFASWWEEGTGNGHCFYDHHFDTLEDAQDDFLYRCAVNLHGDASSLLESGQMLDPDDLPAGHPIRTLLWGDYLDDPVCEDIKHIKE